MTFNACYDYLRRKYPRRHSLKNRLRYLFTHHVDFTLWESADGDWLCGEMIWRGRKRDSDADARLQAIAQDASGFVRTRFAGTNPARLELAELLAIIFKELKGPAELDGLATVIAHLQGIVEDRAEQGARESDDDVEQDAMATLPDPRADVATQKDTNER